MKHVKVFNGTGEDIVLKEGNAGIYREVTKIRVNFTHGIDIDENATYREYVCVQTESGLTVTLTSDDLIDYKEIKIQKDGTSRLTWQEKSVKRESSDAKIGQAVEGVKSIWERVTSLLTKFLKKEKKPAKSENTEV